MEHLTAETFDQNARAALEDTQLRGALRNLAATFGERRKSAIATVENWEGLRERARAVKDETLLHLDKYLAEFTENAEKAGAQIHWARDGREACRIVLELLKEREATRVVKSKSMAAEEIHLNAALEKEGIFPVETDLGEWIIQLAEEMPSHTIYESTDGGNSCSQNGVPDGGTTAGGQDYGGYGKMYFDHARRQLVEPELFFDDQGAVTGIGAGTWRPGEAKFAPVKVADTTLFSHFPIVAIDGGGTYYLIWDTDDRAGVTNPSPCDETKGKPLPNRIRMAVSKDGGKTWSAPADVVAPSGARILWPWAATGEAGKVSIVWYQTDKVVDVDCEVSNVYIYEARIDNAADATRTVTTINASRRPIHQNGVCQGGTVCVASGKDRRLGDFFTNTVDQRGCEIIASGDTTQPDPNTGGPRAVSLPVILRQSAGPALVGGGDCGGARAPQGGNTGTPTCMDHTPPVSTLRQRAVKRSATRVRASGVASDKGCKAAVGLAAAKGKVGQVLISLARTARHGCEFVNRKGRLTKRRSCRRGILMRARGHERWRFALRTRLPRGNYRIDVRAVDITGNKETPNKRRNIVRFRVR